jgi:methionine aminotransferase
MPKVTIESKLPGLPVSIFTHISQLASRHSAINLGQGFPDFEMDPMLQNLVYEAMKKGQNQYAHSNGLAELREIIAQKIKASYHQDISPENEITITPGGTYAISNALTSILRPGDEVIYFEPAFDSYVPNIEILGATSIGIPLEFPSYAIPWEKVKKAIGLKTRMIMLNSPHNPTGSILTQTDLEVLKDLVKNTNILILSDEVYEHLVFDGEKHLSILGEPELFERAFVAFSLGKVFHCTGWKMGYSVAPSYLMKEFRNHHQFNVFSVNSVMQAGMAQYFKKEEVYLSLPAFFQEKRDLFLHAFHSPFFEPMRCKGSYFQCFKFQFDFEISDFSLAEKLIEKVGVAVIPVSSFYREKTDHQVVRICFAKKPETLLEAARRLNEADYSKLK